MLEDGGWFLYKNSSRHSLSGLKLRTNRLTEVRVNIAKGTQTICLPQDFCDRVILAGVPCHLPQTLQPRGWPALPPAFPIPI